MDALLSRFNDSLLYNTPISADDVNELARRYPYFIVPGILYLKGQKKSSYSLDDDLLHSVAILSPNRAALSRVIGPFNDKFANFYPEEEPQKLDTESTIDKFLDKYGNSSKKEISALENAIFNPQPEYVSILEKEDGQNPAQDYPQSDEDRRIMAFISEQNKEEEKDVRQSLESDSVASKGDTRQSAIEVSASASLTETLASSYIKQKKYQQALDILEKISTENYSSENPLVSDRIRFLKKLIRIDSLTKK